MGRTHTSCETGWTHLEGTTSCISNLYKTIELKNSTSLSDYLFRYCDYRVLSRCIVGWVLPVVCNGTHTDLVPDTLRTNRTYIGNVNKAI